MGGGGSNMEHLEGVIRGSGRLVPLEQGYS